MNQLFLGSVIPFVAGAALYALRGGRAAFVMLVLTPAAMGLGMLWAVAPDIPRLLPGCRDLYDQLAQNPQCDMFLWHYTIDHIEIESAWYPVGLVVMFGSLLLAAWRELRFAEGE